MKIIILKPFLSNDKITKPLMAAKVLHRREKVFLIKVFILFLHSDIYNANLADV